jgi:hypothetical protein
MNNYRLREGEILLAHYRYPGSGVDCMQDDGHMSVILYHAPEEEKYIVHDFNHHDDTKGNGGYFHYDDARVGDRSQAGRDARHEFLRRIVGQFERWYYPQRLARY